MPERRAFCLLVACSFLGCSAKGEPAGAPLDAGSMPPAPGALSTASPRAASNPIALLAGHPSLAGALGRGVALERTGVGFHASARDEASTGLRARLPVTAADALHLESTKQPGAWADVRSEDLDGVAGVIDEGALVFRDARAGVDVVMATDGARAEELRVHHVAAATIGARWRIATGPAITEARVREGRIELVDARGYAHLQTAPIVALDADDRPLPVSLSVRHEGGEWLVRAEVDASKASWPVALDPAWSAVAPMSVARRGHHAAAIAVGRVLVVGGSNGATANSTEIYDASSNTWSSAGTIDSTTLQGREQILVGLPGHDALLFGADVAGCTTAKLPCGQLSGRTCVQVQRFSSGGWKPMVKIGPAPDKPMFFALPQGRVGIAGQADDCAANKGIAGAIIDDAHVKYLPTANAIAWDPSAGAAADGNGRVLFNVKPTAAWLDMTSGVWSAGPPLPTSGTIQLGVRGLAPLSSGKVLGIFNGASAALAGTLAPGGTSWDPAFACEIDVTLFDATRTQGPTGPRLAIGADASVFGAVSSDFYRATATGCLHLRYPASSLFMRDGTFAGLGDGRMLYTGGSTSTASPTNAVVISAAGLPNGAPCTDPAACGSGLCTGGLCCDSTCGATCMSCRASETGGSDGTCAPKSDGVKDTRCSDAYSPAYAAKTYSGICALSDGSCNGMGACRANAVQNRPCGASSCASLQALNGPKCDGVGNCQAVSTKPCDPFVCDNTAGACKLACAGAADCASGAYCGSDGLCAPRKSNGQPCGGDGECNSAACVDSYCCGAPCTGQCQACDVAGHEGSCWPVDGTPHGTRKACDGTGPCAGTCTGASSVVACGYPTAATDCGSTCASASFTESTCDGHGTCVTKASVACGAYACDGATPSHCAQSCTTNDACTTGYVCNAGKCIPEPKPTCSADGTQSTSGLGAVTACGAYRCDAAAGTCRATCASTDECAAGNVCDGARTCVTAPAPAAPASGGCSIGVGPGERGASSGGPIGAAQVAAIASIASIAAVTARLARRRARG
jgi:hypothetical protein